MRRGYIVAAVVLAVLVTLALVGCPKKTPAGGEMTGPPPGMMNMMEGGEAGMPTEEGTEEVVEEGDEEIVEEGDEEIVEEGADEEVIEEGGEEVTEDDTELPAPE